MDYKLLIIDSSVVIDAFDTTAVDHANAYRLIETARRCKYEIVIPMHGLFEIKCALHRIVHIEKKQVAPPYTELNVLPFKPLPIDNKFMERYGDVDVPYAKAGDTIYLVMAKKLGLPLITQDKGMYKRAKEGNIRVFFVSEAFSIINT